MATVIGIVTINITNKIFNNTYGQENIGVCSLMGVRINE